MHATEACIPDQMTKFRRKPTHCKSMGDLCIARNLPENSLHNAWGVCIAQSTRKATARPNAGKPTMHVKRIRQGGDDVTDEQRHREPTMYSRMSAGETHRC